MKTAKRLITALFFFVLAFQVNAQVGIQAGAGFAFGTFSEAGLGLQLNSHVEITEEWEGSFSFTYFFAEENFSIWMLDFDAHYVFDGGDGFYYWPQAGINITSISVDIPAIPPFFPGSNSTASEFGLSIGGGAEYELSEQISLVGGIKFVISDADQLVFNATALYRIQ